MTFQSSLTLVGTVCVAFAATSFGQDIEEKDRIGVLVTGWGSPASPVLSRAGPRLEQSIIGEKTNYPDEPCTQWHVGSYPYQSEKGLIPFGVAFKTEGYEEMWDSSGIYRLTDNEQTYVALIDDSVTLSADEVQDLTATSLKDLGLGEAKGTSILVSGFAPDPRDGSDYLAGLYQINTPNGLQDFKETGAVWSIRTAGMLGELPNAEPRPKQMTLDIENYLTDYMADLFGDKVDLRFGYYGAMEGISERLDDTAIAFGNEGFTKFVLARETADHNLYANNFMELYAARKALCKAGFSEDEITIAQVRQVGRTPEHNALLVKNLERHFEKIMEGTEVSIIYVTHGQPWPGSNPDNGVLSTPAPRVKEVIHENAFLNFLSFKQYALAAFDERYGGDYRLNFSKGGGEGAPDSRTNSLFAYAMATSRQYGHPDDPLRYSTIRENLETALLDDNRDEIILVLAHWYTNGSGNTLTARTNNEVPLNSKQELKDGIFFITWCEDYRAPGEFSQMLAVDGTCPEDYARIQLTEAFEDFADEFSNGYAQRIRGGAERLGVLPDLGITISTQGDISKLNGGTVTVAQGDLTGTRLEVKPDPRPLEPDSYEWKNIYRPYTDANPNTDTNAIRPINNYTAMDDYLDSAKDDFVATIGIQEQVRPNRKMPKLKGAVSATIYFGPYRTIFNAPATITIPYNPELVEDASQVRPFIYNELTREFDPVYPVPGGEDVRIDELAATATFDVQVLGNFVLAEAS